MQMRIRVVFYGRLKQDVGAKIEDFILDEPQTVGAVVEALTARYPALTPTLSTVAYTIGAELVTPDAIVRDGDELGLLPPVSGG